MRMIDPKRNRRKPLRQPFSLFYGYKIATVYRTKMTAGASKNGVS